MQAGSKVRFVDESGGEHTAIVHEVTGTGESLYKILTLSYTDGEGGRRVEEQVPHENDAEPNDKGEPTPPFWREIGAARRERQVMPEPVPGGGVPSGETFSVPILPESEDLGSAPAPSKSTRTGSRKR